MPNILHPEPLRPTQKINVELLDKPCRRVGTSKIRKGEGRQTNPSDVVATVPFQHASMMDTPGSSYRDLDTRKNTTNALGLYEAGGTENKIVSIAVIGDVHNNWDQRDEAALARLNVDIAIFVGDFANEDTSLVEKIAETPKPDKILFILGNHDAWYSLTERGRQRAIRQALKTSNPQRFLESTKDPITSMLNTLGDRHLGFSSRYFEDLGVSFVGARPFSKGGKQWSDMEDFYTKYFEVSSMEESGYRILDQILSQPDGVPVVVVAHNGPLGLGGYRYSPCGVDWMDPPHDFGDPDLYEALDTASKQGRSPALVLFGHMHHSLKGGGLRDMAFVDPDTGTIYLNAAVVPRYRKFKSVDKDCKTMLGHHFLVVDMEEGNVTRARNVWATSEEATRSAILYEEDIIKTAPAMDGSVKRVVSFFRHHFEQWETLVCEDPP